MSPMSERIKNTIKIIDIEDDDDLYRRIHPHFQKENGKISSAVFKQRNPYLSIDVAKLTTPEKSLANYPDFGLASIVTKSVRNLSLEVYHQPKIDSYAHGIIEGNITDATAKKLTNYARLVI